MEYIVAFIMLFAGASLGPVDRIDVYGHALTMYQATYPGGQVDKVYPATVTLASGSAFTTPHVFRCLRPKTDEDRKLDEQGKKESKG